MRTFFLALRALTYMIAFVLLFGWIALGVRAYDHRFGIVLPASLQSFALVLMALGGMLVMACGAVFVITGRGTPAPFDPPREFVALGPYRYVRNPIYIGGFVLIMGFGLYQRSVAILLLSLLLLFLTHPLVVYVEEPQLEKRFARTYLEYKNAVNRWIPRRIKT
ncbi:MAG: isoprenylcysteine carboxylmethyltransferase family protein [Pyrinomonadaceae bacterium]